MAEFKFRLETLLKLRCAARDERRAALAEAYEAEALLRQQIEQTENQLNEAKTKLRDASKPGAINVDDLLGGHRHELMLHAQIAQLQVTQNQLNDESEQRRRLLVEADKQVRTLEKLKVRQHDDHVAEQRKREYKAMDEIATVRFGRELNLGQNDVQGVEIGADGLLRGNGPRTGNLS